MFVNPPEVRVLVLMSVAYNAHMLDSCHASHWNGISSRIFQEGSQCTNVSVVARSRTNVCKYACYT